MPGFGRRAVKEDTSDQNYTIVFEDHPDFLFALVHGEEYGYEVLTGFLKDIADQCKARGYSQVLIEENISASATKELVYRVACELPELGFAGIRMAYVDRFSDQREVNEFGRAVAIDNGIDVRQFTAFTHAAAWLSNR
jgi:hypothetical protein